MKGRDVSLTRKYNLQQQAWRTEAAVPQGTVWTHVYQRVDKEQTAREVVETFQTGSPPIKTSEAGYAGPLHTGEEAGNATRGLTGERMNNK